MFAGVRFYMTLTWSLVGWPPMAATLAHADTLIHHGTDDKWPIAHFSSDARPWEAWPGLACLRLCSFTGAMCVDGLATESVTRSKKLTTRLVSYSMMRTMQMSNSSSSSFSSVFPVICHAEICPLFGLHFRHLQGKPKSV